MMTSFLKFPLETEGYRCDMGLFWCCKGLACSHDYLCGHSFKSQTNRLFVSFPFPRYQPEQPNLAYQMARSTEETDNNESVSTSESQTGFLPEEEEKFSLKAVLCSTDSDPSKLSGLVVSVSTFILGECWAVCLWGIESAGRTLYSPWWEDSSL